MKQKLLLPLLLVLLTCLGVQAQDASDDTTVTFGDWSNGSIWSTPFGKTMGDGTAVGNFDGKEYSIKYHNAYIETSGSSNMLFLEGTSTVSERGSITLPNFGRKVAKIVINNAFVTQKNRVSISYGNNQYIVDPTTGKNFFELNKIGDITIDIPSDVQNPANI